MHCDGVSCFFLQTLAKLASFSKKIQSAPEKAKKAKESPASDDGVAEKYLDEEDLAVQRDLETGGWLAHKVKFGRRFRILHKKSNSQDQALLTLLLSGPRTLTTWHAIKTNMNIQYLTPETPRV